MPQNYQLVLVSNTLGSVHSNATHPNFSQLAMYVSLTSNAKRSCLLVMLR